MQAFECDVHVPSPKSFTLIINDEKRHLQKKKKRQLSGSIYTASTCFHSKNVPAHVFLPMYQLISDNSQHLKKDHVDSRIRNLLKEVDSFHLSYSNKSHATNVCQSDSHNKLDYDIINFKATPYPSHLFQKQLGNEKDIIEQLRQVRIKARAVEMMKKSSLPFTQKQNVHYGPSFVSVQEKASPSAILKMHDHMKVLNKLEKNFVRQNKLIDYQLKLKNPTANLIQPKSTNKLVSFGHTKTSQLRQIFREKEKERIVEEKEQELVTCARNKTRHEQLQKEVSLKIKMHNQLLCTQDVISQKLLSYRHSQQVLLEEYQQELQEMRQRLRNRPLLIEQQTQKTSKDAAIKHIQSRKVSFLSVEANTPSDTLSQDLHSSILSIETSVSKVDKQPSAASQ